MNSCQPNSLTTYLQGHPILILMEFPLSLEAERKKEENMSVTSYEVWLNLQHISSVGQW